MSEETTVSLNVEAVNARVKEVKTDIERFFVDARPDSLVRSDWERRLLDDDKDRLISSVDQVSRSVQELREWVSDMKREGEKGPAILALNSVAVLEADFEVLDERVTAYILAVQPALQSAWNRIKNIVIKAIKAIGNHLWQIILTALTLKEWSVEGSLSSGIFGLASVKMNLTFGK